MSELTKHLESLGSISMKVDFLRETRPCSLCQLEHEKSSSTELHTLLHHSLIPTFYIFNSFVRFVYSNENHIRSSWRLHLEQANLATGKSRLHICQPCVPQQRVKIKQLCCKSLALVKTCRLLSIYPHQLAAKHGIKKLVRSSLASI